MNEQIFSRENPARVLSIMPHQDDFEFNAGGTFAALRRKYGDAVEMKVVISSKGSSGHHLMGPDETFFCRMQEAVESATLIGAKAECLTRLDGTHVDSQVLVDRNLLGGIWNAIRSFKADYLFCPPMVSDPLAAVHVDHEETARAIRLVGYQLGVPRAYPAILPGAGDHSYRAPLIILCDDSYNGGSSYDIANPVTETYATKVAMAKCHRSQIYEWLPFNRRLPVPDEARFEAEFLERQEKTKARFGVTTTGQYEFFRFSRWGRRVTDEDRSWLFSSAKRI